MEGIQEEEVNEFDFGAAAAVDGVDALGDIIVVPGSAESSEETTSNFDLDDDVSFSSCLSRLSRRFLLLLSVRLFSFRELLSSMPNHRCAIDWLLV